VIEQVFKAERKRDSKSGKKKRDAIDADDDHSEEQERPAKKKRGEAASQEDTEASPTPKSEASSSNPFDPSLFAKFLAQLAANAPAGSGVGIAAGAGSGAGIAAGAGCGAVAAPADPRAAERARLAAEKEAKREAQKSKSAIAKAAAADKRKATLDLGLAAKAQVLLVPVSDALKAIDIKDDLEAIVREPLQQAKETIDKYMKEATAMQAAAKKKDFGTNGERLPWTQKELGAAVATAKDAIKKYEQFMRMFHK
jgi:hypothetical protein